MTPEDLNFRFYAEEMTVASTKYFLYITPANHHCCGDYFVLTI